MLDTPERYIWVRRQWNDWRSAKVRLSDVDNPHWDDISGGVNTRSPRPFIHGYVWCNAFIEGDVAHSCTHDEGPHRIKVCVVQKDNGQAAFRHLKELADRRQDSGSNREATRSVSPDQNAHDSGLELMAQNTFNSLIEDYEKTRAKAEKAIQKHGLWSAQGANAIASMVTASAQVSKFSDVPSFADWFLQFDPAKRSP